MTGARVGAAALGCGLLAVTFAIAQDIPAHTSVGRPQRGRIAGGGIELPVRGDGYHFATHRENPTAHFGTPALVGAIQRATAAVAARMPGADLCVQDLSFERGGTIQGHGSHTSGRDADICYYARREDGTRIDPSEARWFLRTGRARGAPDERFDEERNWLLLTTLLADPEIEVQYFFMHRALQARLLDYGRENDTVERVDAMEAVLRVPHGRNMDPHADHFHIRIRCPEADRAFGCVD
ncbi:MAG: penicillin-insensitive murein endopeptidase [Sandaracinaceae bacterium]